MVAFTDLDRQTDLARPDLDTEDREINLRAWLVAMLVSCAMWAVIIFAALWFLGLA